MRKGPKIMLISAITTLALVAAVEFAPRLLADAHPYSGVTTRGLRYLGTSSALGFLLLALVLGTAVAVGVRQSWRMRRKRPSKEER